MLKSWLIQNFKPILDSGELKLAPVTVLAGRNSSGKSSLLQSILMIDQTLSSRILDRALLPTGLIIQLGTFEDILSEQTDLRTLVVGFELEMEKEEAQVRSGNNARRIDGRVVAGLSRNVKSAKIRSTFRSASSNGASTSAIEASKVNVESVSLEVVAFPGQYRQGPFFPEKAEITTEFGIDIQKLSYDETNTFLKNVPHEYLRLVPYPLQEPNYLGTFKAGNILFKARMPEPSLIAFSHFLPSRLIGKYLIPERRRLRLVNTIDMALEFPGAPSMLKEFLDNYPKVFGEPFDFFDQEALVSDSLRQALRNLYKDEGIKDSFSDKTIGDLISWYKSLKLSQNKKERIHNKLRDIMVQGILEKAPQIDLNAEALEAVTNNIYVEHLERAIEQIVQFFTSKIRYLGPLRADPQAAQKFSPSTELDDVGTKGEYAAAVYDANQNARIRWYNPFNEETEQSTLKSALDTWARYLGVAHEIKIQMAGQSGVSWQVVHIEGHKALPLTAVGVGISQILPILVMGLLAPNNSLLIVEQPELHLHPSVQARLGDFFMGLAKCGKQCLIETHSENLVSQLRYHIVQAGGLENSDCLIYFVDQDEQGAARFNPIEISPNGNILNWPDGFFDETMLQEDRITTASLKKRAKKAHDG
ncbi:MAG TPA: DUF3696 domain-containing protein [Ktedonosporobacter sp.]|jgi:predicted ATPase|nr:DUF3696 domain-containing protein [Ktedonosporobacter sp.]